MNFGQAVVSGFRNYINFSGRASRSEFWFFILFTQIVGIVCRGRRLFCFLSNRIARRSGLTSW
jgi:uncharacterized membrane protein YhaH (DUF805 family)